MKSLRKTLRKTKPLNVSKFKELLKENKEAVISNVFHEAVRLALVSRYGSGLLGHHMVTDPIIIAGMEKSMSPLIKNLEFESGMSFFRCFGGMLEEPDLRGYFLSATSSVIGKTGGRKKGYKSPHIQWLEHQLIIQSKENTDDIKQLTAKEHFKKLASCIEIQGEDEDGNRTFTDEAIDEFIKKTNTKTYGNIEPKITLNAVEAALTSLKKSNLI